jgi:hypothetical protein
MVCPIADFGINYFEFEGYFALACRPVFYLYTFKVRSNSPFSSRHTKYENRQVNKASKTPVILHATNYLDGKRTRSGLSSIGFQLKSEYSVQNKSQCHSYLNHVSI